MSKVKKSSKVVGKVPKVVAKVPKVVAKVPKVVAKVPKVVAKVKVPKVVAKVKVPKVVAKVKVPKVVAKVSKVVGKTSKVVPKVVAKGKVPAEEKDEKKRQNRLKKILKEFFRDPERFSGQGAFENDQVYSPTLNEFYWQNKCQLCGDTDKHLRICDGYLFNCCGIDPDRYTKDERFPNAKKLKLDIDKTLYCKKCGSDRCVH